MTLAIGDRVRFKEDYNSESGPRHVRQASTGLVRKVQVAFNGGRLLTVDVDEGPRGVTVYDFRVEKIEEPAPRFKVGDKVRLKSPHPRFSTGKVTRLTGYGHVEVLPDAYRFPAHCAVTPGAGTYHKSAVEKIEQSVPFRLERGDKVVNRKTGRKGYVAGAPSGVLKVYDLKPPYQAGVPVTALEEYEDHYPNTYDLIKKDAPW